jgi:dihydroorotate dehydrogenase electron transfer subunit
MGTVEQVRRVSAAVWDLTVRAPLNAAHASAGQFVHVRVSDTFNPFLRRPLSVGPCEGEWLRLIFTVRGKGTSLLTGKVKGDRLDIIGPLGSPFQAPPDGRMPLLVAGGIGIVPLLLLDDKLPGETRRKFLLGVRGTSFLPVSSDEIAQRGIIVSTDDGSMGFGGSVIDLLRRQLDDLAGVEAVIYACGPGPMLSALKGICRDRCILAYVSLEVPMGCGLGACQSCAVPRADGKGYYLVCHDGPVFDIAAVDIGPETVP